MINEKDMFEEAVFAQYFLSTIKRNPNPPKPKISGALDFISVNCKDKENFLSKNDDGSYKEDTLNAAWWAWDARSKIK